MTFFHFARNNVRRNARAYSAYFLSSTFAILFFFLYFRLYTILNENKDQYRAIAKIGLTETEMRRSVTIQLVVLFFAPFLMAILNTACAMVTVQNNISAGTQVLFPTVETISFFLIIQVLYFWVVRTQYLHQVKHALI